MCGLKNGSSSTGRGWLVLLVVFLLLCLGSSWLHGETVYTITETELTELETILTEQEATIKQQAQSLNEQASLINQLREIISEQETSIDKAKTLFVEYEKEARRKLILPWTAAILEAVLLGLFTFLLIK